MKTPEGHIKDKIRAWLREQGAYVFSPTQMGYGQQTVDLLVCWPGKRLEKREGRAMFVAIEVKAPGKKPTPRQIGTLYQINEASGFAFVAASLDDVINLLHGL